MMIAHLTVRTLVGLYLAVALATALAQTLYPTRTVRIIVPTSPPGGADIVARSIAPQLSERLGQQVIVDNRAGASTMLGHELAAKAPPDGYTLVMGITVLYGTLIIVFNLLADLCYAWIDPRVRLQ